MKEKLYRAAMLQCGERYLDMAERVDAGELYQFVGEFVDGVASGKPLMKMNRWLGYIQGTLITIGATTVKEERDWTRPLFRPLDFPEGAQ